MSKHHLFPWWGGFWLLSPFRKLVQNPIKITEKYIKPGMNVLDIGCGMGYFTIPMAKLTGENGVVIGVDLQEKMLLWLEKRIKRAGLADNIISKKCSETSLNIKEFSNKIDFALAFSVVHEIPDKKQFFLEIYESLKNEGIFYIAEPSHISKKNFDEEISIALKTGFKIYNKPENIKNHALILIKKD